MNAHPQPDAEAKHLGSASYALAARFGLLLLLVVMTTFCVNVGIQIAASSGGYIPTPLLERDYLTGIMWGAALTITIFWWPASAPERAVLIALWGLRLLVTLVAMLAYERQYDSLDSYTYFADSREIALSGYVSDATFGTGNVTYAFSVMWYALPPSYHALKVSCAYVGLAAALIFFRAWRIAMGGTSLLPLWIVGVTPSMLFWSSSLGKEPLIYFGIAAATWGAMKLWRDGGIAAVIVLVAGLAATFFVRPWMALIFGLAVATAFVVRPAHVIVRVAALAIGASVIGGTVYFAREVWGVTEQGRLLSIIEVVSSAWAIGGSANDPITFSSLSDVIAFAPLGAFTALFRPLPGEIGGAFGLLAGAENAILLVLVLWSAVKLLRGDWQFPLVFALAFVVWWTGMYAFISYQNLGTAARFKMQVMPFLMALIGSANLAGRDKTAGAH